VYTPRDFEVSDPAELAHFIEANSFGILCSEREGRIEASHLPFLLDAERRVLRGHMARANPQWHAFEGAAVEALVIFHGPHAYVSPAWYAAPHAVPTWNYEAVHVYGTPRLVEEDERKAAFLADLVAHYESGRAAPWRYPEGEAYAELLARMRRAIVAFEIPVARTEGKAKLSQNRGPEDRAGVRGAVAAEDARFGPDIARRMAGLEGS
jgi:transcriptional regulator